MGLPFRQVKITSRLIDEDGKVVNGPSVVTKLGQEAKVSLTRELIYPVAFDLPIELTTKTEATSNSYPITPTTPTAFESKEIGDTLHITARARGAFIELSGSLTASKFTLSSRAVGEAVSPIYDSNKGSLLTENYVKLPEIHTVESRIYVAGLPGKDYEIKLADGNATLVIRCDLME